MKLLVGAFTGRGELVLIRLVTCRYLLKVGSGEVGMLRPLSRMETAKGMLKTATRRSLRTRLAMKRWEDMWRDRSRKRVLRNMQLKGFEC